MAKLSVDQALLKAKSHAQKGEIEEAQKLYNDVLQAFPKNKRAQQGLAALNKPKRSTVTQGPPQDTINQLINLYNQGQWVAVIEEANTLTAKYPDAFLIWNILGAANKGLGRVQAASEAFKKVTVLNPTYAEGFNNLGATLLEQGELDEAIASFYKALSLKPNNATAYYNMSAALQEQGKLDEAIASYHKALSLKPNYAEAYNNMGTALQDQGKLEEAITSYTKALSLKPDYVDAYNNMGNALKGQGELEKAITSYEKALSLKPDYAEAYNNMGNALQEQGKVQEAIASFNTALSLMPDYALAYNNMGNALQEQGKLEEAIEAYNNALSLKPQNAEFTENLQSLVVQLLPIMANYCHHFDSSKMEINSEIVLRPKYQILNAIKAYLEADFGKAYSHNNNFKACDRKLLDRLKPNEEVFCNAYSSFIGKLLDANWDEEPASENKVYHLGESHSLSYAHRNITISGLNLRIAPRMTFGAKAFHFARSKYDRFKAITRAHLVSLPKNSQVFLSFGEIDCRPDEGFIPAATKLDKSLEELIDQTTEGYVKWFLEQNAELRHKLYFVGVPAPFYDKKLSADLNSKVARAVALFNIALEKYSVQHGYDMVDVFKFTVGKEGFSNGLFHIDNYHLGAKSLPEIEQQLS